MNGEELKAAYWIIGFVVVSNISLLGTMLVAGFRIVFNYAVLQTSVKALHRRVDRLEGIRDEET